MVFQCINIRHAGPLASGLGFQHLPQDLANVNAWKTMFDDPYSEVRGDVYGRQPPLNSSCSKCK